MKTEIERLEKDIENLKRLKKEIKYGFLKKSIPMQIKHQKELLKQLLNK